ncbi:MAG TPA: ABC transporter ATP-binding protein [Dehalococcoidia bacterium]|nr:ABC transporter ATP-binding protein [Dehalococcoidia bacterium]
MEHPIELAEVSQQFGSKENPTHALRAVSLAIPPKQVAIVMGPSGAGKSTLLAIAGALRRPTSGEVLIDGVRLSGLSDSAMSDVRLRKIGFVFQEFNLLDALTVMQNLELVLMRAGVPKKQADARATEILSILDMDHRRDAQPKTLSGGERQRVAIARALVNNPIAILADEPTASLDGVRGAEVMSLLQMIAHDMGTAVLMVSHDHRVLHYADRIVWLEDGHLEDREPPSMAGVSGPASTAP